MPRECPDEARLDARRPIVGAASVAADADDAVLFHADARHVLTRQALETKRASIERLRLELGHVFREPRITTPHVEQAPRPNRSHPVDRAATIDARLRPLALGG